MALPHARLLDVIDVKPRGDALSGMVSTSLLKTDRLQLLHLVLPAGHEQPEHYVDDECCIHCLEGEVLVQLPGGARRLGPGQMMVLPGGQRHRLSARIDSAVLMTLLLDHGDATPSGHAPAPEAP